MELKLKSTGEISPFIDWLKKYNKITNSILLEIDPCEESFIAKTFTEDKACVRYSKIKFDECGLELLSNNNESSLPAGTRIKLGILLMFPKFIKIIESYSGIDFSVIIDYDNLKTETTSDFIATSISFKSDNLKMKIDGFKISEFKYLDDNIFFNNIHTARNPIDIELTDEMIKNIIKFSGVGATDDRTDQLVFFNQKEDDKTYLTVKDNTNSFEYKLSEINALYDFNLPIFRSKFLLVMKDMAEPFKLIIGDSKDRILLDSETSETKMIISIINI